MNIHQTYNILDKINGLAEGDTHFKKELVALYASSFKELRGKFATIITSQDIKELSFISHKYRTTFIMFDMDDLAREIDKSKSLLSSDTLHIDALSRIIVNVETSCDNIIRELSQED